MGHACPTRSGIDEFQRSARTRASVPSSSALFIPRIDDVGRQDRSDIAGLGHHAPRPRGTITQKPVAKSETLLSTPRSTNVR
jgi:hypothetical protein